MSVWCHTRHKCGHSIYWSDPDAAVQLSQWPCPWCGAATGTFKPPKNAEVISLSGLYAFRNLRPDGTIPPGPNDKPGTQGIIIHMSDESCCQTGGKL